MNRNKLETNQTLAIALIVLLLSSAWNFPVAHAGEWIFPRPAGKALLQTNGPKCEIDSGDWWTNEKNSSGSQPHVYEIYVPADVESNFTIRLEIYDPECFSTYLDMDQKKGFAWDNTTFTLWNPQGDRMVSQRTYEPLPATSGVWVPFASFTAKEFGSGIYRLLATTALDDKNSYVLKIKENDPDGVPLSGDEIHIAAVQTAIHHKSSNMTQFSFYVPQNRSLVLANFDADRDSTWAYFTPHGDSLQGTSSDNGVWNDGSVMLPPPGGDLYENPIPGWWQVRTFKTYGNQFTFYCARPFLIDTLLAYPIIKINTDDGIITAAPTKQLTYQIRIQNQGQAPALRLTIADTLEKGISFIKASDGATILRAGEKTIVTWKIARLKPDEMIQLFLTASVQNPGSRTIINKSSVTYTDVLYTPYDAEEAMDQDVLYLPGQISGWIWRDQNYDGAMTANEPGLANIILLLTNSRGDTVATTTTTQNGSYRFDGLAEGEYRILLNESSLPFNMNPTIVVLPQSFRITFIGERYENISFGFEMGLNPVEISKFSFQAAGGMVRIQWITESETNNIGFNLLRSTSEHGDYVPVNPEMIPGSGDSQKQHTYQFDDRSIEPEVTYYYKLEDIDYQGRRSYHGPLAAAGLRTPESYRLGQNYPNPFNGETVIDYQLKRPGFVKICIYNLLGQQVRTLVEQQMEAGSFSTKWDGKNAQGVTMNSGAYFYVLQTGNFRQAKKMHFIK